MHCPDCGLIVGKDYPPNVHACPRCERVLRVLCFDVEDDYDRPKLMAVETGVSRRVLGYVNEARARFLLSDKTTRPDFWQPLVLGLEEQELVAFSESLGWKVVASFRDPGPVADERARPFEAIERALSGRAADSILVRDFDRVTRMDLRALWTLGRKYEVDVLSVAPHPSDRNLALGHIDYDTIGPDAVENRELERLWTREVSEVGRKLMDAVGWYWTYYFADLAARAIGADAFRKWRDSDPLCRQRPWREVLTSFAIARARRAGELERLPLPELRGCELCRAKFLDVALPPRLMELTVGRASYCGRCLLEVFGFAGVEDGYSEARDLDAVVQFFRELPAQRLFLFLSGVKDRLAEVRKRHGREVPSDIWLTGLRELGHLDRFGAVTRSERLFRTTDGHLHACLGSAMVDNWLTALAVSHRPDARYPTEPELNPLGTLRADFLAGDVYVEFLGLRGGDEFSKAVANRVELARRSERELVLIYAEDLVVPDVLERKARAFARMDDAGATKPGGTT